MASDSALGGIHDGADDEASHQLVHLLSVPAFFSVAYLSIDPTEGPLRDHSRFQALPVE